MNDKIIALVHDYVTLTCLSLSDDLTLIIQHKWQVSLSSKHLEVK